MKARKSNRNILKQKNWLDSNVTELELSRLFGRSQGAIWAWAKYNNLLRNPDGTFNLKNSICWLKAHYRQSATIKITLSALTQCQLAELLGVSRQSVFDWGKKGLPRNGDNSYDLMVVLRWLPKFYDKIYRDKYKKIRELQKRKDLL